MKNLLILLIACFCVTIGYSQTYTGNKFITKQNGYIEYNNNNFYTRIKNSASASANWTLYLPGSTPSNNTLWGFGSSGVTLPIAGVKGIAILSGEVYGDSSVLTTRYRTGSLLGITSIATSLGTFTGTTLTDNTTVKALLQELETATEQNRDSIPVHRTDINNLQVLTGRVDGSTHLGTFTGTTITDNVAIKIALQELETAFEAAGSGVPIDSITALRNDINNLQTLSGRPDNSTHLATFTGTTISDNGTIKAALQELETSLETKATGNFATTNLTLTASRTHAGGGFDLTINAIGTYTFALNAGSRTLALSSTAFTANTETFEIRNVAGQSTAEAVLRLYEDRDNGSPNDYVGLRAATSVGTSRIWTLPDADATAAGNFWSFNSSEVASLTTYTTSAIGEPYSSILTGSSVLNGNQTAIAGHTSFNYNSTSRKLVIGSNISHTNGTLFEPLVFVNSPASTTSAGAGIRIRSYVMRMATGDTMGIGAITHKLNDGTFGSEDAVTEFHSIRAGAFVLQGTLNNLGNLNITSLNLGKTITAAATTGDRTINMATGSVNFAAAATTLTVTNSLVTANSVIQCTVATDDTTMESCTCVAGSGSFVITPDTAPSAETRVNFTITN